MGKCRVNIGHTMPPAMRTNEIVQGRYALLCVEMYAI